MSNLMKFESQDVEIILDENGHPLFELYSTGMALGYIDIKFLRGGEKGYPKKERIDKVIENADIKPFVHGVHKYLSESMLYDFMLEAKTEKCKPFRKWITNEVLPQINHTGGYIPQNEGDTEADIMAKALLIAQKTIENKDKQLEVQHSKVLFADSVQASKTSILVGDLAKIIRQNGHDIGGNRLFRWLREKGYLIKRKGTDYNMPTQKAMELELFEIKETSISHADGHISISKTPKVTGKGQIYFVNKFNERVS